MIQYLREVLHLLGGDRRRLPWLIALFLVSSLLDLVGIGLVGPYIALIADPRALEGSPGRLLLWMGVPRQQQTALVVLGLLLVGTFLLKTLVAIAVQGAVIRFSSGQQVRLQSTLMHAYQHLPYAAFLKRSSAEFIHGIGSLTSDFGTVLRNGLRTVSDAMVGLVLLGLLALQNLQALALLAALLVTMLYGYDRIFRRRLRSFGEQANRATTTMYRGIQEGIEGLKEIRILGKEEHFHRMVREGAREVAQNSSLAELITLVPRHVLELSLVAFMVILVLFSLSVGDDLSALIPTLGVFGVAALRLMPAANSLSRSLIELRYNRDSVARLYRDLQELPRLAEGAIPGAEPTPAAPFRDLVLDRIGFTYPGSSRPALHDVSMEIRSGESIGLIGPSGAGKTTLVDVLLGLLEPQAGEIRHDGRPLKDSLAQWRGQVAYLPQQVFLIDDSIRRNVALGVPDGHIDAARLDEALRQARLAEVVAEMPDGLDTLVGERGVRLSGGQKQRVALARAFYYGRSVLVMDEATSALDSETEREIVEEIRRLKGRKTVIVIAHRLSTVRDCDRFYRLKDGTVVSQGTYDQVIP